MSEANTNHEPAGLFRPTRWSKVLNAKEGVESALGELFISYRHPLYVFGRKTGLNHHDAEDLVGAFVQRKLINSDFLGHADKGKGLFRTFLLTSFKNFLIEMKRHSSTVHRGGGIAHNSLDEPNEQGVALHERLVGGSSPVDEFNKAWYRVILDQAVAKLEKEISTTKHAPLWPFFMPALLNDRNENDRKVATIREIAKAVEMTEGAVKQVFFRLRKRLSTLIKKEIEHTVATQEELTQEIDFLMNLF